MFTFKNVVKYDKFFGTIEKRTFIYKKEHIETINDNNNDNTINKSKKMANVVYVSPNALK